MSRYRQDDRAYHRPPNSGDEEPRTMGPWGKALLLIALVWVCWAIYKFTPDRQQAAEPKLKESAEYTIKRDMKDPGNFILKEKKFMGVVHTIPKMYTYEFQVHSNDVDVMEFKVMYKIPDTVTPEELLSFHADNVNATIRAAIQQYCIEFSSYQIYKDRAYQDDLMSITNSVANKFKLEVLQLERRHSAKFMEYIERVKKAEIAKHEAEAEMMKAKAKEEALKNINLH